VGGALGRPDPRGGVVDHLSGRFLLFAVGVAPTPEAAAALEQQVGSLISALQPWAASRDYVNFREVAVRPERLFDEGDLPALRALRDGHDPQRVLVSNHSIG
jgi:hypothetical protein